MDQEAFEIVFVETAEVEFKSTQGTNFFDSLVTDSRIADYSFTLLTATYLERTGLKFEPTDFVSFGLADRDVMNRWTGSILSGAFLYLLTIFILSYFNFR